MSQAIFEELVDVGVETKDAIDAIRQLGTRFEQAGFVKDSYVEAVAAREAKYPTGLQLENMGICMPHTKGAHVNRPAVGVFKLKSPVTFSHMGDPDTKVQAELVFMMAILNSDEQLDLLQKVMKVFTNRQAMAEFKAAQSKQELLEVSKRYIDS